jgi:SAM-dependent methyltransferase
VLEVGCGTGAMARQIARRLGDAGEIVGLDLSGDHVEFATSVAASKALENLRFQRGDGRRPPEEFLEGFDVVIARYVLMYAIADNSVTDLILGMIRCLRPGGRLLLIEADINFGSHMYPPPAEPLASVMRELVRYYRDQGGIEWRAGIRLFQWLTDAGLIDIDVRLLDCRIIRGGHPRTLVKHDGLDLETLMAPVLGSGLEGTKAGWLAEQWRGLLADARSFVYTPVFIASWIKPFAARPTLTREDPGNAKEQSR